MRSQMQVWLGHSFPAPTRGIFLLLRARGLGIWRLNLALTPWHLDARVRMRLVAPSPGDGFKFENLQEQLFNLVVDSSTLLLFLTARIRSDYAGHSQSLPAR
jgi:hypothetical protein